MTPFLYHAIQTKDTAEHTTLRWQSPLHSAEFQKNLIISICDLWCPYKKFLGEKASSPALLHLYAMIITEVTERCRVGLQRGQIGECL